MKLSKPVSVCIILYMMMLPFCYALDFSHLMTYTDGDGLGSIQFSSDFTASRAVIGAARIVFYDLKHDAENTFGDIGILADENASLTFTSITPGLIEITYTGNGTCEIYAPRKGMPSDVTGVEDWSYDFDTDTITFTQGSASSIVINFGVNLEEYRLNAMENLNLMGLAIFVLVLGAAILMISQGVEPAQLVQVVMIAGGVGIIILVISAIIMNL